MNKLLKHSIITLAFVFLTSSCATTSQFLELETKTDALAKKVSNFEDRYSEVLNENKYLKEKLQDLVPVSHVEKRQIHFEIHSVKRSGSVVTFELLLENKSSSEIELTISKKKILIVDEFGNQYRNLTIENEESSYLFPILYPNSPLRYKFQINDFSEKAEYIGTLGFNEIQFQKKVDDKFIVFLKNILLY